MPCHHALAEALHAYIAAGIGEDKKAFLFRTSRGPEAAVEAAGMGCSRTASLKADRLVGLSY